jgi:hypothetical protein
MGALELPARLRATRVLTPLTCWLSLVDAYALSEWAYRDFRTSGWELMGALKLSVRLRATRVLTPLTYWASQADAYALSEWAYRFAGGNG